MFGVGCAAYLLVHISFWLASEGFAPTRSLLEFLRAAPSATAAPAQSSFKITVNGRSYDVSVEDLSGGEGFRMAAVKEQEAKVAESRPAASSGDGKVVKAPLTGDVLKVIMSEGQAVKTGDEILVLEAMKMETKVVSPYEGKISRLLVKPGDKVQSGDGLVVVG